MINRILPQDLYYLDQEVNRTVFIDLKCSKETEKECSKLNKDEALITIALLKSLTWIMQRNISSIAARIGVVTPYKAQVRYLKDQLA